MYKQSKCYKNSIEHDLDSKQTPTKYHYIAMNFTLKS